MSNNTRDVAEPLAERLERFADANGADTGTCREAAAELRALREERDRLRESIADIDGFLDFINAERVEGWASINLEDDNVTRDNFCSCPKAGSWNFHADCGHVSTHTPATLLISRAPTNPDTTPTEAPSPAETEGTEGDREA